MKSLAKEREIENLANNVSTLNEAHKCSLLSMKDHYENIHKQKLDREIQEMTV
jgi:formylmethanofuran dehydrogenase subunit B